MTVVETLVAMMILAIGLLGLASTAGYVVRQVGGAANQTVATQVFSARLEWLRSMPCASIVPTVDTTRGVRESWYPSATVNSVLWVVDTLQYPVAGSQRTNVFTMTVPCA